MSSELERELLLKLRGKLSKRKQCPGYLIFGPAELELLLKERPTTIAALSKLKGFPSEGSRVKKWGASIIDVFTRGSSVVDFELVDDGSEDPVVKTTLKESSFFSNL